MLVGPLMPYYNTLSVQPLELVLFSRNSLLHPHNHSFKTIDLVLLSETSIRTNLVILSLNLDHFTNILIAILHV